MENYISIESQNNIINLGYPKKTFISQLSLINTKIILLLTNNDLIIYDQNTPDNTKIRRFSKEIQQIKSYQNKIFILQDKLVTELDSNNLEDLQKYDLKEKPYLIQFKDTLRNFICFYVNEIHEIIYMNSYFLTEIKKLYKENEKIENILYNNNILLWCTKSFLKVFNLENKIMLLKKNFSNYFVTNEKSIIECSLFGNLLSVIYQRKYLFIYYLDTDVKQTGNKNRLSFEIFSESVSPLDSNEYYIGVWININIKKLCIIRLKNDIINLCIISMEGSNYNKNFFFNSKIKNNYFYKEYKYIYNPDHNMKFIIGEKNMYLYDNKEIFLFKYSENKEDNFMQDFINSKEINFNLIKDNFDSLDLNKKYFTLVKIIEKDTQNNYSSFLTDKIFLENYIYLYEEFFNLKNPENKKNENKLIILYNNYILYILKTSLKLFNKLYYYLKNKYDKFLIDKTKEKITKILLQKKQFNILAKFISKDNSNFIFSPSLQNFVQNLKKINDNNMEIKQQIIYIEALLNQKIFQYKPAIKSFIEIKKLDEIYNILINQNQTKLIFDYDILFQMFEESKLVTILDFLYSPLNLDDSINFYKKIFSLCDEVKITKLTFFLIFYEKYRLLINSEIIQKLFNISIKNNNQTMFENIYERYKYKNNNKLFLNKFIRDAFKMYNIDNKKIISENIDELMKKQNSDIYILLLTNINNYKKIIDIYIDHLEQPEQCIKYIENANLNQNIKQDIYNYLGSKINNSKCLSDAKKFYYITQFQDDITIKKPDILKMFENINYNKNTDDFEYILLILKELRLKLNTLQTSKEMSYNLSKENFDELKKKLKKGKILQMNVEKPKEYKGLQSIIKNKNKMKCNFDECDKKVYDYGDNVVIFKECKHCFHKECFLNIKEMFLNENSKYYLENNFCPKCFDII